MTLKDKKILFIGDSITFGVGVSDPDNIYWRRLAINDCCITKGYGISGTRIARNTVDSIYPECDGAYFRTRLDIMDDDADVITVFGGTNDFGHGDAPLGTFDDRSDYTFYGAMHNLIAAIQEKYPNAKIVFLTPAHRLGEDRKPNLSEDDPNNLSLQDYVDAIISVATYYDVPVLDLYRQFGIDPANLEMQEKYMPDGLHLSDDGHARLYKCLKLFLNNL